MINDFKKFILRGNVIDLAVGVVMGAAFGNMVNSLVKDMITPLIGSIANISDFSSLYFSVHGSKFLYGDFLNNLISFILIAITVYFFVILPINALLAKIYPQKPSLPTTKQCPECKSDIPTDATRCAHCGISLSS